MPDECQSMPITEPSAWNQNGSLRRDSSAGAAVVVEHALGDRRAERHHARRQPRRHAAAVQREVGNAGALHEFILPRDPGTGSGLGTRRQS